MTNIAIEAPLVNGSLMPYIQEGEACKFAVELIGGDDQRPPPRCVKITIHTELGKLAVITIPNDIVGRASILIDGEKL